METLSSGGGYPDEKEVARDLKIIITLLNKLFEFGEGGKEFDMIRMDTYS